MEWNRKTESEGNEEKKTYKYTHTRIQSHDSTYHHTHTFDLFVTPTTRTCSYCVDSTYTDTVLWHYSTHKQPIRHSVGGILIMPYNNRVCMRPNTRLMATLHSELSAHNESVIRKQSNGNDIRLFGGVYQNFKIVLKTYRQTKTHITCNLTEVEYKWNTSEIEIVLVGLLTNWKANERVYLERKNKIKKYYTYMIDTFLYENEKRWLVI